MCHDAVCTRRIHPLKVALHLLTLEVINNVTTITVLRAAMNVSEHCHWFQMPTKLCDKLIFYFASWDIWCWQVVAVLLYMESNLMMRSVMNWSILVSRLIELIHSFRLSVSQSVDDVNVMLNVDVNSWSSERLNNDILHLRGRSPA